jgi:hypothetical protein
LGTTVSIAASPASLIRGGATNATPGSLRRVWASESIFAFPDAFGSSAAITSGPFEPAPKPSVLRS